MRTLLSTLALLGPLTACTTSATPGWDAHFGEASRQMRAAQTADPDAPSRPAAPAALDGKAAAGAQTGYAASYGYAVKEAKPPLLTVLPSGQ